MTAKSPDDRSFADGQQFLLLAKRFWTTELTRDLKASAAVENDRIQVQDPVLEATFGWLERHLQRAKYSGRYGLQRWMDRDRKQLMSSLVRDSEQAQQQGVLELNPELNLPDAFTRVDIHQHPGGVWSDPLAGLVYERGARTTTPMAGQRHKDLHDRLAEQLVNAAPEAKRVLDMGCGFGKSTGPIADLMPQSEIVAVDIAEPCLTVAARDAIQGQRLHVTYRQADARQSGESAESVDAVTSTMLLHEMAHGEHAALFDEAFRTLKPGGVMMHLDFLPQVQPADGPFLRYLHEGHLLRNNEPYMADLMRTDLDGLLRQSGFTDIRIEPFAEADGALDPDNPNWRFPWALISARKPAH
jgi:ubiquinone/menaquinone biosynthesis C-methylase UbiE